MANDEHLATELLAAGERSGDRAWRMPLWEDYQQQLDSPFADMANVGGRAAGSITAAVSSAFHQHTTGRISISPARRGPWQNKGASGRPVPLLFEYLLQRADDPRRFLRRAG